jgi:thiol-disulfide isomerase/thioredoxin
MSAGVIVLVAVLIMTTAFGLAWRRRQGRLRAVGATGRPGRHPDGSAPSDRAAAGAAGAAGATGQPALTAADLRHELGPRATLVQFSSAFCAPCRATRQILGEVAGTLDGVSHVEIDAESRLDLVRRLGIFSTPTVLVLGPGGVIARQASGQPRKADVIAALGELLLPTGSADEAAAAPARD